MTSEERRHAMRLVALGRVSAALLASGCSIEQVDTEHAQLLYIDRSLGRQFTLAVK